MGTEIVVVRIRQVRLGAEGAQRNPYESIAHLRGRWLLLIVAPLLGVLPSHVAHAWAVGSQLDNAGCHEPMTAAALRTVRTKFDTAPVLKPSRDEAAMIADVLFAAPSDFVNDLAGMTLLVGVRDNDLKGINPLSSLDSDPGARQSHDPGRALYSRLGG